MNLTHELASLQKQLRLKQPEAVKDCTKRLAPAAILAIFRNLSVTA